MPDLCIFLKRITINQKIVFLLAIQPLVEVCLNRYPYYLVCPVSHGCRHAAGACFKTYPQIYAKFYGNLTLKISWGLNN